MGKPSTAIPFQKIFRALRVLDFAGAGASIAWGVYLLCTQGLGLLWPYVWLVGGLAGAAFAYWSGAQRLLAFLQAKIKRPSPTTLRAVRGYPAPPATPFRLK